MSNLPFPPGTRANILWHALAFSMRDLHLGRSRARLTEEQRFELARQTILRLRRYGGWKLLDEVVEPIPVDDGSKRHRPAPGRESHWKE